MKLEEAVSVAAAKRGGSDGHLGWASTVDNDDKSGKRILCEELIELTKTKEISWIVSRDRSLLFCRHGNLTLLLEESVSGFVRHTNDDTRRYSLRVFNEQQEVFSCADNCSITHYNSGSSRKNVMNLWDMATQGKLREIVPAHVCGLQGFGASGDTCPACDYFAEKRTLSHK